LHKEYFYCDACSVHFFIVFITTNRCTINITTIHITTVSLYMLVNPQADHQQTRTPNTHRWHTHAATYCVIIQTQATQISWRNSNGTKHSGGPPEDGGEKRPKHVGVLYLQTRF